MDSKKNWAVFALISFNRINIAQRKAICLFNTTLDAIRVGRDACVY
jgi:hypothetical protein